MTAGRPAGGRWSVGLDIGGTKVLGVLLDGAAAVRATARGATRPGAAGVVAAATEVVQRLCAGAGLSPADLAGVGAGLPGLVDPATGRLSHAVNLGIAEEVEPAPMLAERLGGVPVVVENDLNVAAVGAARELGLSGDLAFLALGTGVAAGVADGPMDGDATTGLAEGWVAGLVEGDASWVELQPPIHPATPIATTTVESFKSFIAVVAPLSVRWSSQVRRQTRSAAIA